MTKEDGNKHWKFKASGDYYKDLAMRESSNQPNKKNKLGYKGLYQMGDAALIDAGYISRDTKQWTGKHGIKSEEDFLHNRLVQDIAIREYHQIVWRYLKDYYQYEGQVIKGIKLTKAGMIAAAHLVGHGDFKKFIKTNGEKNEEDRNGVSCSQYLQDFSGYDIDYSTDNLIEELKIQQDNLKRIEEDFSQIYIDQSKTSVEQFSAELLKNRTTNKLSNLMDKYVKAADEAVEKKLKDLTAKGQEDIKNIAQSCQAELDAAKDAMMAQAQAEADAVFIERKAQAELQAAQASELSSDIYVTNADFVALKEAEIKAALDALQNQLNTKIAAENQKKQQEVQGIIIKCIEDTTASKKDILEKCNKLLNECVKKVYTEAQKGSQADLNKVDVEINESLENFTQLLGLNDNGDMEAFS